MTLLLPTCAHRPARRRARTALVTTFSMLATVAGLAVATTAPASAGVTSVSFTDASEGHAWKVPLGVSSITVDALGGSGNTVPGSAGGAGAHVLATLDVVPGSTLFVHVAGNGGLPGGGANGGGAGSAGFGGGGGASDVRETSDDLAGRVLVAGGGGGQGFFADGGAAGQAGGGDVDPPFIVPAGPGTDSAGGAGGVWLSGHGQSGTLGQGGDNSAGGSDTSSGGGGGYYGGGGGAVYGSGAGGSSYVEPDASDVSTSLGSLGAQPYVKVTWTTPVAKTITVSDVELPADGTSTATVTATVTDRYGQAVPGDTVTFTASDAGVTVGPVTDHLDGTYTATVTASTTGGSSSITAHDGELSGAGTLVEHASTQPQTIVFTSTAPDDAKVGGSYTVAATGGDSGQPVTFSVDPSSADGACTVSGDTVTFTAQGSCVVAADQAGDTGYDPAPTVTQTVEVSRVTTTTTLSVDPEKPVFGQDVTATATVTAGVRGAVQFSVDDENVGDPVTVDNGSASKALPSRLSAKGYQVKAVFTPTDTTTYEGSSGSLELGVAKALTKTTVKVRSDEATVVVDAVAPGSGTPEGDVVFTIGDTSYPAVTLDHGKATLDEPVPADAEVSAVYSGDDDFAGSSDSTLRTNPTITAAVTSERARSPFGWYRTPVVVTFTCTEGSAPLVDGCPEAVTLSKDGASQDVTRTITAQDGGIATVSVTGIDIDQTKPEVRALGVEDGARYFASAPEAGCIAVDDLSGVYGCRADRKVRGDEVTYSVAAIDRAGNESVATVDVTVYKFGVAGADYADGVYTVKKGQHYDLIAASSAKPRLYKIVGQGKKPYTKGPDRFRSTGDGTWAYTYYMGRSLKVGKTYNIGIRTDKIHVITIHVV